MRRYSSPEKLFEYFASVSVGGERFMTPDDFIRAITPYNPSIDDWTAVGSTNSKFTTQQLPAPLSQASVVGNILFVW